MGSNQFDQSGCEEDVFIFPASFAQQRLWFVDQLLARDSLYVIPLVFRLAGSLHRAGLQQSIQAIVDRHEILRTSFEVVDSQLVQVVVPKLEIQLPEFDLRDLPTAVSENTAMNQIWEEVQQPFCLNEEPLFRVRLWHLQDQEHLLLIALHHIIFDEWSSGVLIRELGELYAAFLEDRPATLPELSIQYADYAHWQRQWLRGEALDAQLHYWKQQLKGIPVLQLPGAISSPTQSHQGASQLLELPQPLLDALEKLSQEAGVTLFMTLLAAFQTLLHRYTGQTDIAIGSPIANRHRVELEQLIGFLVNSLVLRVNLANDPTFRELLDQVREVTLAAYAHQDLPFEKLVEELQPVRSLGQNPLFQVVFALQNTPMEQLELPGLVLSPVELETKTARFDLELYLWKGADNFRNLWGKGWQQSDGLRGLIVYNTSVLGSSTITSLRHHFQKLLEKIVENPDAHLSALQLLTIKEQQEFFQHWNGQQFVYPANVCIHELFELQVEQRPNAIAIKFNEQCLTYQELNQRSNQLARYLQQLGVCAETPVGICLEQGLEAIVAMLAVLKAGGAYVPMESTYPLERLQFIVRDAQIAVVLTQSNLTHSFPCNSTRVISLENEWNTITQQSNENLSNSATASSLAYVIYTSGSTGNPKGVMVTHRAVNRLVCETNYIRVDPGDRVAQVANLAFDAATFEVWGALLNGAQLTGIEREVTLSPTEFVAKLQQEQIDILFLTTALFNQVVNQIPAAFQSLKYLLFGGEIASVNHVRTVVQQGKPQHLIHVYGPTENTTFSTWHEIQEVPANAITIPIGHAVANTLVYLLDANLNPVPAGVCGEIYLAGDGLARGYLNRPELTAERFILNPFESMDDAKNAPISPSFLYKTGDRALYCSDGDFEFLGRTDNQVKIRGFRVELGEIETIIMQHPLVQTAIMNVHQLNNNSSSSVAFGDQLIAYVVPKTAVVPTEQELRAFLKSKLPAYMLPARFIVLSTLPLTPNGKVDRKALPPSHLVETKSTHPTVIPVTSLESSLLELWIQLLGRKQISIHDNFFELGGHSLLATQLVSRIRDRLRLELPLRSIFETPTIAELAEKIESIRHTASHDSIDAVKGTDSHRREEIEL